MASRARRISAPKPLPGPGHGRRVQLPLIMVPGDDDPAAARRRRTGNPRRLVVLLYTAIVFGWRAPHPLAATPAAAPPIADRMLNVIGLRLLLTLFIIGCTVRSSNPSQRQRPPDLRPCHVTTGYRRPHALQIPVRGGSLTKTSLACSPCAAWLLAATGIRVCGLADRTGPAAVPFGWGACCNRHFSPRFSQVRCAGGGRSRSEASRAVTFRP